MCWTFYSKTFNDQNKTIKYSPTLTYIRSFYFKLLPSSRAQSHFTIVFLVSLKLEGLLELLWTLSFVLIVQCTAIKRHGALFLIELCVLMFMGFSKAAGEVANWKSWVNQQKNGQILIRVIQLWFLIFPLIKKRKEKSYFTCFLAHQYS